MKWNYRIKALAVRILFENECEQISSSIHLFLMKTGSNDRDSVFAYVLHIRNENKSHNINTHESRYETHQWCSQEVIGIRTLSPL